MQISLNEKQFLKAYFLYDRLSGCDEKGRGKLFSLLRDIYCVDSSLNEAFAVSESENVRACRNLEQYSRMKRIIEFAALSGKDLSLTKDELFMLEMKADGMREAVDRKLTRDEFPAGGLSLLEGIKTQVKNENVFALTALGLFYMTGLSGNLDETGATWMLKKSAKWNNTEALLCILKFFEDARERYLPRIYTVCYSIAETELWGCIAKRYNVTQTEGLFHGTTYLLEKLFTSDENYHREKYVATYARILNSTFLSFEDKKRILFSKNRETITRISDLPLKDDIPKERRVDMDAVATSDKKLEKYLKDTLLRINEDGGKFPLIIGDTEILKQAKAVLLKALSTFTVEVINAQYLTPHELQKTADNIFISKLTYNKDINTVFIIEKLDKMPGNVAADIGEFFDPNYRKIRMMPLNVTLNLSGCKFIGLAASKPGWVDFPADIFGQPKKKIIGFAGDNKNETAE